MAEAIVTSDTLDATIQSAVLDQGTGNYYVATSASSGNLTLAKYATVTGSNSPTETTVHADALGTFFGFLTISQAGTSSNQATLIAATDHLDGGTLNKLVVTNGTLYTTSNIVADSTGNDTTYGIDPLYADNCEADSSNDGQILGIAATTTRVFCLVKRALSDWLCPGSAINVYDINSSTLALSQIDQQEIMDSRDFIIGTNSNNVEDVSDTPLIHYNDDLKMLYVANKWVRSKSGASDGVRSVAAYSVNPNTGVLTFTHLHSAANTASSSGWNDGSSSANKNIIGVVGANKTLSVHALSTMKTSTDNYYLIIAGGNGTNATTGNTVWALPLVKAGNANAGTLADTTLTALTTQATDSSDLYSADSTAAKVGNGTLPWGASIAPSCMQVIANTVYIATNDNSDNKAAIYYSKASFDSNGKIRQWSSWKKAGPIALGTSTSNGSVRFFAVNTRTAKIWTVPGADDVVRTTAWSTLTRQKARYRAGSQTPTQSALGNFKTSPSITQSFTTENNLPVALTMYAGTFTNGQEGIVFVRKESTDTVANSSTVKATTLPSGSEKILSCGMTSWSNGSDLVAIPLVGTQKGLYAFIHSSLNTGGDPSGTGDAQYHIDDLSQGFWSNGTWKQILPATINGNVTAINSQGNGVYITVRGTSPSAINDTVFRFDRSDVSTNTLVNATAINVISSQQGATKRIYSAAPVTSTDTTQEQIYLGTGNGILYSNLSGGSQGATQNDFNTSSWQTVSRTTEKSHVTITVKDNTLSSVAVTANSQVVSIPLQISYDDSAVPTVATGTEQTLSSTLSSIITQNLYWTDGARTVYTDNGVLKAEQRSDSTTVTNISTLESAIFGSRTITSIDLTSTGVLEVATESGIAELS